VTTVQRRDGACLGEFVEHGLRALVGAAVLMALGCGARSELPLPDEEGTQLEVDAEAPTPVNDASVGRTPSDDATSPTAIDAADGAAEAPFDAAREDDGALADAGSANGPPDASLPPTAACLTGGNVLWVDGDSDARWFVGTQTDSSLTGATFAVQAENYVETYDGALLEVHLPNTTTSEYTWFLEVNTWPSGEVMQTGVTYPVTTTAGSSGPVSTTAAYMQIAFGSATCGLLSGSFRLDQFTAQPGSEPLIDTLVTFTASFEAACEQPNPGLPPTPGVLRGCIHYDMANPNP
jgi:hypothetical protein